LPPLALCCCGHEAAAHDAVAARYCAATAASTLDRACICPLAAKNAARSYDRR
jgi:hypothetical protein